MTELLQPFWDNDMFAALDAAALSVILKMLQPRTIMEVGSGNSTKFARWTIERCAMDTKIVSVDPQPRFEVDALCDEVIRAPVEAVDLAAFDRLESGDIFFLDGSHRALMNSDVTVVWLDILPRLRRGVTVHIHDIFLPDDYPLDWSSRFYSEQYLLAASLLAGADFRVLFPSHFVQNDSRLYPELESRFGHWGISEAARGGSSFWFTIGGGGKASISGGSGIGSDYDLLGG
jgi:hypothetical protein